MSDDYEDDENLWRELWYERNEWGGRIRQPPANWERKAPIPHFDPHYTDDRFKHPQVIWGQKPKGVRGIENAYSDRLWQWDYARAQASSQQAQDEGHKVRSADWAERFLSLYQGYECELLCVMAGWNWATGYSYQIYFWKRKGVIDD